MPTPTLGLLDIRFLLARSRGEWLPEEQNGLAPFGPTGIRDVQGVGNNTQNELSPNWWFGAADTLFPRLTFNRLTTPTKKNDVISSPFANSERGPAKTVTIGDTATIFNQFNVATTVDALNPRNISNLIVDSDVANNIGFNKTNAEFKLMDDPTGRVSPITGAVNPLVYSNWMSQFGQFFDHGLDFVNKGDDGKVAVELLPSDGLYTAGRATTITGSRNNTVNVNIGEGSSDALLAKLGLLAKQGVPSWSVSSTLTKQSVDSTPGVESPFAYQGTLVLNNTLIMIAATDEIDLVNQINFYTPTTGIVASATSFPEIGGVSEANSFSFNLAPARAESFNQTSPFIDLSQTYGSDNSRMVFLREYLAETDWRTALNLDNTAEATVTDLTTGRLVNAGVVRDAGTINEVANLGIANWAEIKANALNVGITLHDADITAIPLIAFDQNGQMILDANGMPQLIALNKVTGAIVYVKDTTLANDAAIQALVNDQATNWTAGDFVLMTTKHAFLNDMGVRLPALTDTTVWDGRDLKNGVSVTIPGTQQTVTVNYKTALEAHYVAGDGRLNENIGLTAVQEVFVNEHNRVVEMLKEQYGFTGPQPVGGWEWTDPLTNVTTTVTAEELFQQAKLFNEMTYQHLVFDQFVRKLSPNIAGFAGVNPLIDARITAEFAHAVYRFGHSMLPEAVGLRKVTDAASISTEIGTTVITVAIANHGLKDGATVTIEGVSQAIGGIAADRLNGEFTNIDVVDGNSFKITLTGDPATSTAPGLAGDKLYVDIDRGLIDAFLAPQSYTPGYTAGLLADGSTAQVGNRIDEKVTDALRDNLLGQPLDLATLNIVRGRDAGLPTLNEMRAAIQAVAPLALQATLTPYTSWTNFRDNLKGTPDDQEVTVKNFIMAYAPDAILSQFAKDKTVAEWYDLRDSLLAADQIAYMTALKAAAEAAYANATWMGTNGNLDFNRIDAWVGGLAEREVVGGMLGSTFDAVFAMQMMNLQNGDFFYYLGRVPTQEFFIENMEGIQLSDIVMRATGATNLYGDIFSVADKYIQLDDTVQAGQVYATQAALQAVTTTEQVFDAAGNVITAAIGTAGYVGTLANRAFYGNSGNYVDARGVLNPNGVGNASEMIAGTAAADTVFALGGNDTVRAAGGDDNINGGSGADFLYGGDGDDTLDGGSEDDFMYGEAGNDTMLGGLGIDTMFGADGIDTMYGGADADVMVGGTGDDIMYGGDGIVADLVDPVTGAVIRADVLDAEPAVAIGLLDDSLSGGQGNDQLFGGGGWDTLIGNDGHDTLFPGTGGNAVGGRESMDGGQGDDIYIIESDLDLATQDIADSGLTQLLLVNKGPAFRQGNGIGVDEVRFTQTVDGDIILAGTDPATAVASIFSGVERVVIGTGTGTVADRTGTAIINIDASLANPGLNVGLEILANAADNTIVGTAFSDIIDGGEGLDIMEGGLGNDTYIVDDAGDVIVELTGGGLDTVSIDAASNVDYTLAADLENLILNGTANGQDGTGNNLDNVITGSAARNAISGLAGADTLYGGGENDTMNGGDGDDTMYGELNLVPSDPNFAITGNDTMNGGNGNDTMFGENGNDTMNGDAGNDTMNGGAGNDTMSGGTGTDTLNGDAGNDTLNGDAGSDTLNGGDGNDRIVGGADVDVLSGGAGSDVFAFTNAAHIGNNQANLERITDFVTGTDRIDLSAIDANTLVNNNQAFTFIGDTAFVAPTGGTTAAQNAGKLRYDSVTNQLQGDTDGDGVANFSLLVLPPNGTPGPITQAPMMLHSTDFVQMVDIAPAVANQAIAEGTASNSTHTFNITLSGAAATDTYVRYAVTGTGGNAANATDFGGTFPSGTVLIRAGQTAPDTPLTITVRADATAENNETFQVTISNVTNDAAGNVPSLDVVLGTATATSTINNDDVATGITINGNNNANTQNGGAGNDTLNGNGGNDTQNGNAGNDTLNGGAGNDTMNGGDGDDLMNGGTGFDTMNGGAGVDTFRFISAAEIGGAGALATVNGFRDQINAFQTGVDKIELAFDANTGSNGTQQFTWIGNATFSAAGQLRFDPTTGLLQGNTTGTTGAEFSLRFNNGVTVAQGDIIGLANPAPALAPAVAPAAVDPVPAPAAVDPALAPAPVPLTLNGGNTADTLVGGEADDVLNGNGGNDNLIGNGGADRLNGGAGFDTMDGGAGADAFIFNAAITQIGTSAGSRDVILNFESGVDTIDLSAIDANAGFLAFGNQAFTWIGDAAFTAAGQIRFDAATGLLEGNVNANRAADFAIEIRGGVVTASDMIL